MKRYTVTATVAMEVSMTVEAEDEETAGGVFMDQFEWCWETQELPLDAKMRWPPEGIDWSSVRVIEAAND